ncbi:extradiol ring-cleavage dioxygenase [Nocardioides zeae]|uniref:Extradiol ring-cleavage dioxygenase n=1 Tax=Nocardioides zeae TaxID=1457234 RepID=A0A6P0HM14_9ACTN|nr:extradiol ring-cleavage dioxygenase [Nocardioides zeae]NEN79722.1 extradiol ring-cleavage dioxygenase [Nocardioides zeae]
MGEAIGLGITHYPLLAATDEYMAALMSQVLTDPDIPDDRKDPANWSDLAQQEWSDDRGAAAAAGHRKSLLTNLAAARQTLDEFEPDLLIVWGDDQYENFREEVIPSFCILAYPDTEVDQLAVLDVMSLPNAWGLPSGQRMVMRGNQPYAKKLAQDVLADGVDVAYSYEPRRDIHHFPHAFANTQVFLDYENVGKTFPYPIVSVAVNCYGEHVIARRGGIAPFAEILGGEDLDPPGPSPQRCYEFGRAVGRSVRKSDKRVALVASASWSHAFLNDKDWHLRPDTAADRELYDAMVRGDHDVWTSRTVRDIVDAGQHEMLNWFCLLGAVSELGLELESSEFVETEVFNSNKAFATFR